VNRVVIIGAGGFGRETLDIYQACNAVKPTYSVLGFVDEDPDKHKMLVNGIPVVGGLDWFEKVDPTSFEIVCTIGASHSRRRFVEWATKRALRFGNVIHPSAIMTPFIKFGRGVIIAAGSIITNNITIGNHVILNLDCTVGHDTSIGDYCTINPGVHISGRVKIGEGTYIGTGAVINDRITIGEWTIIGAGAVVHRDLPANVTAVGVPSAVIKEREAGWHLKE
jgi:sugar O-acyltransferase (sialic acid O-acetyltransferase NeuD family)